MILGPVFPVFTNKPNSQRPQNSVSKETNSVFRVINIFPWVYRAEQLWGKCICSCHERNHQIFFPAPSQRVIIISNRIHSKCRNTRQYDLSKGITWDSKKNIFKLKEPKKFLNCHGLANFLELKPENKILHGSTSQIPTEQSTTLAPPPPSLFLNSVSLALSLFPEKNPCRYSYL